MIFFNSVFLISILPVIPLIMIRLSKFQKLGFFIIMILLVFVIHKMIKQENEFKFVSFNNVTGSPYKIIPNIVHYVIFGGSLNFISFLSLVSVIKIQQSNIWIHCDCNELTGHYWSLIESLANLSNVPIRVSFLGRPTHVYGQAISSVYHASDLARIQVLMESGGIYLDTDVIVINPLDTFLHYEMVIGWPENSYIGSQVMIAHPKARFLKKYLESYERYLPTEWYYNAGQVPTEQILSREPGLVHRVPLLFGVHHLLDELYGSQSSEWGEWRRYYTVHLLSRHHPDPGRLNETSVRDYRPAFGHIARWLLYQTKPALDVGRGKWLTDTV